MGCSSSKETVTAAGVTKVATPDTPAAVATPAAAAGPPKSFGPGPDHEFSLYYFDIYGRGEAARMILGNKGVKYTDSRIQGPDWPAVKPTIPNGTMPALEFKDGTKIGQS
jgi:hypothetical protein